MLRDRYHPAPLQPLPLGVHALPCCGERRAAPILFWLGEGLAALDVEVQRRLASAGFSVQVLQRDPAFCRLRVARASEIVVSISSPTRSLP